MSFSKDFYYDKGYLIAKKDHAKGVRVDRCAEYFDNKPEEFINGYQAFFEEAPTPNGKVCKETPCGLCVVRSDAAWEDFGGD